MGKLRIVIVDRGGQALPARVSVSGPDGRAYAPDDAWRHADEAFDRAERPFEYSYFHTVGTADLTVPAGALQVEVWRGPEDRIAHADLTVGAARPVTPRIVVERLPRLPARGWWTGDLHVDIKYGGPYPN